MHLAQIPRATNPNSIAENEEFEITYFSDSSSTQKKVKYKKIHTLGVSSLCGLATIAEYIIRRPFSERMAIYKNILKYAHRKNPGDFFDPADSPDSPNIELKSDTIDSRYFQLIEKFQEARNESFKKFIKDKLNTKSSSAGGVSDSVAVSLLARQFKETSDHQFKMITESLDQLDQADTELYKSTYQKVFSNSDGSVDVIAFNEFKKLFQVKSISEIFDFARNRAIKLGRQEVIDSQTVTFFTAYFENDNSCQLWIINLLQNYEHEINKSLTRVLKIEEDDEINQNEDYSTNHLDLFFKLAINKAIDEMLPFNCFEVHDSEDLTQQRYKRRILNITKQDNVFSISSQTHHDPNIDYDISCFFTGGSRSAGAGHYSYCQKEGEKKFPEPILEDSAEIVAKEELTLPALDAAELSAQDPATAWVRFASGDSVAASGDAQAGRRQGWSGGGEESLRRRSVDPEPRTRRRDAIDPTYDYTHQFRQVATTVYNSYCGYGSIANYVKFLSVDERMAFYKKLFADPAGNHLKIFDNQGDITEQSQAELLILEKLLKFREEKFNEFVNPRNAHEDESSYFRSITKEYCKKYTITNVGKFFEDFRKKYKIITPFRESFRQCGPHYYQTWMAQFLKNKLMQINSQLQSHLAEILPDESQDQSDQILLQQNNLYEDQRGELFQFYFENKASARISSSIEGCITITNPEIENKELVWFHRALIEKRDEVGATEDQKLFYQLYDYFLKKYIQKEFHNNIVEHDKSVPYQHFYTKENYNTFLQTAVDINTIASELNDGNDRPDLSTEIAMAIKSNVANVEYFLIKIAEHFRREFSFEKQFVNLLHSDTFFTQAYPGHYTTMIPTYKAKNPFPDKDSNLDVEAQLQSDDQQLIIQKQNVEEAFKSAQMAPRNIDLRVSLGDRPSPTLINSYHSISFTRLHGRQNNNYSYVEENREGQSKSTFSKINSIIEDLKTEIGLDDKELAMAIFLSKKFGGIGTKSKKILNYYRENNRKVKDYLENNNFEIFKKMINFSYRFQKECRDQGIYSGNERLADDKKKEFGLRLSFVPDEIFRFHLNKLPKDSITKKLIIGEIKQSQDTHVAR